ncbi:MAG TPA: hypothetical protein VHE35_07505 [Kofleriaceae bacterium]|nr:hypothetical protein [Kofleriaceae bacterium]
MIRWLGIAAKATVVLAFLGLGIVVGLFLVANAHWIAVDVPPWLEGLTSQPRLEIWLPALIAGWLAATLALGALIVWSMYYLWRRRQYEALIARLERELVRLRNLPFVEPSPLEDLPETPDAGAAKVLVAIDAAIDADPAADDGEGGPG